MKIRNLKMSNWRYIICVDVGAQDMMIVIGQSNHGTSNLLSAIRVLTTLQGQLSMRYAELNCRPQIIFKRPTTL